MKMRLFIDSWSNPELVETRVIGNVAHETERCAVRALDVYAKSKNCSCFKWTRAVQALTVFLLSTPMGFLYTFWANLIIFWNRPAWNTFLVFWKPKSILYPVI